MLFMICVAVATLPIFFYGYRVGRTAGFFFVLFYLVYITYLILETLDSVAFTAYRQALLLGVAPATGLYLLFVLFKAWRQPKNPA